MPDFTGGLAQALKDVVPALGPMEQGILDDLLVKVTALESQAAKDVALDLAPVVALAQGLNDKLDVILKGGVLVTFPGIANRWVLTFCPLESEASRDGFSGPRKER